MILLKIIFFVVVVLVAFHFATRKYLSPFRLKAYIGKKGSGKSTLLTKHAYKALKQGRKVYSTEELTFIIKGNKVSTIHIDPFKIPYANIEAYSLVLLDEINLYFDNRDFASKSYSARFKPVMEWLRLQRHYKVCVNVYTQTWDFDKKIRELCDDFYLVNKLGRVLVIARHMIKKPVVVHPSADAPARVDDDFIEDGLLLAPFGGIECAWIPYWSKLFDSFKLMGTSSPVSAIPHGASSDIPQG